MASGATNDPLTKKDLREELDHFGKTILSTQLEQIIREQLEEYCNVQMCHQDDAALHQRMNGRSSFQSFHSASASSPMSRTRRSVSVNRDMGWLKFALGRGNWDNTVSSIKKAVKPRRPTWLRRQSVEDQEQERRISSNGEIDRNSAAEYLMGASSSMKSGHSRSSEHRRYSRQSRSSNHSTMVRGASTIADSQKVKFMKGDTNEDDIEEEEYLIRPMASVMVRPSVASGSIDSARELSSICSDDSSVGPVPSWRSKVRCPALAGFVRSHRYDYCAAGLAILSCAITGVQTNYMACHWDEDIPVDFLITQSVFCAIYVCEVAIRLVYNHPSGHEWDHPAGWRNFWFDFVVIGSELFREVAHYGIAMSGHRHRLNFSILPLRLLRFILIVPSHELHQLGVSFLESFRYLVCAILLIFIMTFLSGIFFTEYVVFLKVWHSSLELEEEQRYELDHNFGTVPRAMISLFQVVSDGIHWHDLADPLISLYSEWVVLPFILYAALAIYSLMNIIVGIFVDSAVRTADTDNKVSLIQEMHAMFQLADEDGSGTLSWDEFERFLDHPQMCKLLRAIDLDQDCARQLFRLLDEDQSSEINHSTFINRCMRFHGAAKAVDLAAFMHEYQRTMKIVMDILEDMEQFMSVANTRAA